MTTEVVIEHCPSRVDVCFTSELDEDALLYEYAPLKLIRARMGSEDGGGGELALPAAESTMRHRIYPRIFRRYSSAGK